MKEQNRAVRLLSLITNVFITTVACIAIGICLGLLLDRWLGTSPIFLILLLVLGVAAAFKNIYDIGKKMK